MRRVGRVLGTTCRIAIPQPPAPISVTKSVSRFNNAFVLSIVLRSLPSTLAVSVTAILPAPKPSQRHPPYLLPLPSPHPHRHRRVFHAPTSTQPSLSVSGPVLRVRVVLPKTTCLRVQIPVLQWEMVYVKDWLIPIASAMDAMT